MQHFWVVGTDTDVGKTCVTTLLMRQLQEHGLRVAPYKPVQTGEVIDNGESYYYDTMMYQKYSLQSLERESLNGYSFKEAASPHFAAQLEGQQIDGGRLLEQIQVLQQVNDVVICEGAGGLFVPLDVLGNTTLLDVIVQSKLPVVVVTRTTLGTINHTLLTLEALRTRHIEVLGLVFNSNTSTSMEQNNIQTILQHQPLPHATIPKLKDIGEVVSYNIEHTTLWERLLRHEASIIRITNKRFTTCMASLLTNERL
ncbi:ATP-dependent dethiobiotin synthetase BioD [Lysinibacillus contaminans]|uniref:ATP-dependent dethiobiotin synthetase BioD n=1 Tax=Lysinibacillus contaminans TaxID=1293441 RepID=A0ABR5K0D8_9BACI|nr:dethiobiotin synthase [Lysinibacillus contaminans]KOS68160.1 ATP-dependent dethiobiotin synthetase BioD [Lysinibacillus contaminans]